MASEPQTTEPLPLGIGQSSRWMAANWILLLAHAVAPKELGYLEPLARAARYASDRVQGKVSNDG